MLIEEAPLHVCLVKKNSRCDDELFKMDLVFLKFNVMYMLIEEAL